MVPSWSGHHGCSWLFSGWSAASECYAGEHNAAMSGCSGVLAGIAHQTRCRRWRQSALRPNDDRCASKPPPYLYRLAPTSAETPWWDFAMAALVACRETDRDFPVSPVSSSTAPPPCGSGATHGYGRSWCVECIGSCPPCCSAAIWPLPARPDVNR